MKGISSIAGVREPEYREHPNFQVLNGTCQGNNEDYMYGPLNVTFVKWEVPSRSSGVPVYPKRRCDFTFVIDSHICRPKTCDVSGKDDSGFGTGKSGMPSWIKCYEDYDCCDPRNNFVSRTTSSFQDPASQREAEHCRDWYLAALPYVQAVLSGFVAVFTNQKQQLPHCRRKLAKNPKLCSCTSSAGWPTECRRKRL